MQTITTIKQSEKPLSRKNSFWVIDQGGPMKHDHYASPTHKKTVWSDHPQCFCYKSLFITSCLSTIYHKKIPEWFGFFVGILADFQLRCGRNYSGLWNYFRLFSFKFLWADLQMSNNKAHFSMLFICFLRSSWPRASRCL